MGDWLNWVLACALTFVGLGAAVAVFGWSLCYGSLRACRRQREGLIAQVNTLRHAVVGDRSLSLGALREIEHALRSSGLTEEEAVELIVTGLKAWKATR
jgi:hypothetical protein